MELSTHEFLVQTITEAKKRWAGNQAEIHKLFVHLHPTTSSAPKLTLRGKETVQSGTKRKVGNDDDREDDCEDRPPAKRIAQETNPSNDPAMFNDHLRTIQKLRAEFQPNAVVTIFDHLAPKTLIPRRMCSGSWKRLYGAQLKVTCACGSAWSHSLMLLRTSVRLLPTLEDQLTCRLFPSAYTCVKGCSSCLVTPIVQPTPYCFTEAEIDQLVRCHNHMLYDSVVQLLFPPADAIDVDDMTLVVPVVVNLFGIVEVDWITVHHMQTGFDPNRFPAWPSGSSVVLSEHDGPKPVVMHVAVPSMGAVLSVMVEKDRISGLPTQLCDMSTYGWQNEGDERLSAPSTMSGPVFVSPLNGYQWTVIHLLPSLMQEWHWILACREIAQSLHLGPTVTKRVQRAMLGVGSPKSRVLGHYEQLEYVGDAVMKFLLSFECGIYCAASNRITELRSILSSNNMLAKLSGIAGLKDALWWGPAVRAATPAVYPPYLERHGDGVRATESKRNFIDVSTKTSADCLEALIGAQYLDCGIAAAHELIGRLGITAGFPIRGADCIELVRASCYSVETVPHKELQDENAQNMRRAEAILEYEFVHPHLLHDALYRGAGDRVKDIRNRFFVIGNALLEFVFGMDVLERHPDANPAEITFQKQQHINNTKMSALANRLDLTSCVFGPAAKDVLRQRDTNHKLPADVFDGVLGALGVDVLDTRGLTAGMEKLRELVLRLLAQ